ncbi:hypothetical protein [Paraferrimonas sp. SM1919]|uniref:hypothetical protein n=1 Tax=Paraferrimonas sp. SM1919 TaxID=2662263 RepID=UPI0013D7871B|nr:hypothetical protein [Paraferrimonas sp. SM1919]
MTLTCYKHHAQSYRPGIDVRIMFCYFHALSYFYVQSTGKYANCINPNASHNHCENNAQNHQ